MIKDLKLKEIALNCIEQGIEDINDIIEVYYLITMHEIDLYYGVIRKSEEKNHTKKLKGGKNN